MPTATKKNTRTAAADPATVPAGGPVSDPVADPVDEWEAKLARIRKRKPREEFVSLPDDDAVAEVEAARAALLEARAEASRRLGTRETELLEADSAVLAAYARLTEAEEAASEAEIVFRFRSLPPEVYDELILAHPPTDAQEERGLGYNASTFIPELIAACSVMPLTADQVTALMTPDEDGNQALNQGDVSALFAACRRVNERTRIRLGKGSRPTRP